MVDWNNEFLSKKQVYCRLREISEDYGRHSVDKQSAALKCRDAIMEMPAADVAPVVHGRWAMHSDRPDTLICSICDHAFDVWKHDIDRMHYCPNCGSKMNAEKEDQNA